MELIWFIQVFNIIVIAIGTLLYMCCRSLTFASPTSSSSSDVDVEAVDAGVADVAADPAAVGAADTAIAAVAAASDAAVVVVADNNDDVDHIPPLREKYDVFISFRGEDTRKGFTSHLHHALLHKKFETYIDYRLKTGEEIEPALLEAIEKSRLSVIIFSKSYASSTWCLIELVHILKCRKKNGQMVVPIFYDISPSDVRKQKGSYADAFAKLEDRFKDSVDKVMEWKAALVQATGLCGSDYSNKKGTEADFIEEIVEDISTKLKRETSYDLKGMFGIKSCIEQVESLLSINAWQGVCTVGIHGMGGIGKTTLAKAVFKRLSSKFEACCFLSNVREKAEQTDGVNQLKKTLLRDILKEENLSIDSTSVRERLGRTKVLIVFDDVSDWKQIKDVAGDNLRYGDGSGIMVTSKERRSVLKKAVSDEKYIYEVKKIKTDDALQLFQFHAFKDNSPREEYAELSERVVEYAGGIPLALEVLGSLFFECESKGEWEDAWRTLRNYPNEEIQNTFRVSYNRLGRNAQEVFLDIACFYKGYDIESVKKMVDFGQLHGGSCAADGIRVLHDRSLISIDSKRKTIHMHDLVQEMGWEIVREQCVEEPGRRSRLFTTKDVYHVLKYNSGTEKVQAIFLTDSLIEERDLDHANFGKMYNLRVLHVSISSYQEHFHTLSLPNSLRYLYWGFYPLKSLPPTFSLENLVELRMFNGQVMQLWNGKQNPMNLKVITLHLSEHLTTLPNLSKSIEHINLEGCKGLVTIPLDFQYLDKLTYLDLRGCKSLKNLPEMPGNIEVLCLRGSGIKQLPSSVWSHEKICSLDIEYCTELEKLPRSSCKLKVSGAFSLKGCYSLGEVWELPRGIGELDFSDTAIEVLPASSMECLLCLTTLKLKDCINLTSLPPSIYKLKSLEVLDLTGCTRFYNFPEILEPMEHLEFLSLKGTAVKELPPSIEFLFALKEIQLKDCKNLASLPPSIYKLKSLEVLDLTGCTGFYNFPEILEPMEHLEFLSLKGTAVKELPPSIEFLFALKEIQLKDCKNLASLPPSICKLKSLEGLDLTGCTGFYKFPEILEPIEHLEFLHLADTAVEELPQSFGNLIGLQTLNIWGSYKLKVVPSSIYKLTNLKTLIISEIRELNFPQPPSPVGLLPLEVLDLRFSGILEIPEYLVSLTSLRDINLRGTKIRSIPSSIKQASQLSRLCLNECRSLESIPELPVLSCLEADGCWSLKTVSSSRTAITQCWNRFELHQETLDFSHCPRLGDDARRSIMVDAQLRIMRVATAASKLKEDEFSGPSVTVVCPGSELPNWFVHQNEGASINVTLPANWFREGFLGFALSFVNLSLGSQFKYSFNTEEGESLEINYLHSLRSLTYQSDHVCVLYKDLECGEGAKWSSDSDFYDRVTEVSVHFGQEYKYNHKVGKCGICLLYAKDAEKLKFDVMLLQEQCEPTESESHNPEASGSNESEEASGSDDSGESGRDEEARGSDESAEASGSDESGESGRDEEARGSKRKQ